MPALYRTHAKYPTPPPSSTTFFFGSEVPELNASVSERYAAMSCAPSHSVVPVVPVLPVPMLSDDAEDFCWSSTKSEMLASVLTCSGKGWDKLSKCFVREAGREEKSSMIVEWSAYRRWKGG